jgi:hypothetical protein
LNDLPTQQRSRRARVIRNAVILGVAALAVYALFIFMMAERSQALS